MVSVASWAHRALRGVPRYHHCRDEPDFCERYGVRVSESVIGVYENPAGVRPQVLVITDMAVYLHSDEKEKRLAFADVLSVRGPASKDGDGDILVTETDGQTTLIRVAGHDGENKDVYNMVRFLDRVVALLAKSARN